MYETSRALLLICVAAGLAGCTSGEDAPSMGAIEQMMEERKQYVGRYQNSGKGNSSALDVRADGTLEHHSFVGSWQPEGPGKVRARLPGAAWSRVYTLNPKQPPGEATRYKASQPTGFTFVDYLDPTTQPSGTP